MDRNQEPIKIESMSWGSGRITFDMILEAIQKQHRVFNTGMLEYYPEIAFLEVVDMEGIAYKSPVTIIRGRVIDVQISAKKQGDEIHTVFLLCISAEKNKVYKVILTASIFSEVIIFDNQNIIEIILFNGIMQKRNL